MGEGRPNVLLVVTDQQRGGCAGGWMGIRCWRRRRWIGLGASGTHFRRGVHGVSVVRSGAPGADVGAGAVGERDGGDDLGHPEWESAGDGGGRVARRGAMKHT